MTSPRGQRLNDSRLAWPAWAVLFAVVAALVLAGNRRTVTGNYREAAFLWFLGKDLYTGALGTGHGFLYLPQAAILFAPFAWLPLRQAKSPGGRSPSGPSRSGCAGTPPSAGGIRGRNCSPS